MKPGISRETGFSRSTKLKEFKMDDESQGFKQTEAE